MHLPMAHILVRALWNVHLHEDSEGIIYASFMTDTKAYIEDTIKHVTVLMAFTTCYLRM